MMNSNVNKNQFTTDRQKQSSNNDVKERIIINENVNFKNDDIIDEDGDDDEDTFEGKLLHLSCIWNNPELLSDLLLGDEVGDI